MKTELSPEWSTEMIKRMVRVKEAAETWWSVMESYGVTLEKMEEVKSEIDAGIITRREGWTYLNDKGCPFTINLAAHYFVDKTSLCWRYTIVDDSNLQQGYSDVAYCRICTQRAQKRIQEPEPPAHDIASERYSYSPGTDVIYQEDMDGLFLAICERTLGKHEQMELMAAAPELLEVLSALEEHISDTEGAYPPDKMTLMLDKKLLNRVHDVIAKARKGGDLNGDNH